MSSSLGPIDMECDAPPYPIVRECRSLGMRDPEDVRWCRLVRSPPGAAGWCGLFTVPSWRSDSARASSGSRCSCGQPLPALTRYAFRLSSGREVVYRIGQCPRCRTMYWSEGE
jgi:hypothetical protein